MMVDDGSLTIRAVPNPSSFGLDTSAMIGVDVQPDRLDEVSAAIVARDEVTFVGVSTGRYDLIVMVLVGTLNELREFLEVFLAKVQGIRKTETMVVLDVKKQTLGRMT